MDKAIFLDLIKRYWKTITIVILVSLLISQCKGNSELSLANSSLKKDVETYVSNAKNLVDKNNALEKEKTKYQDSISDLKTKVSEKENEIADIKKKVATKINDIKTLNSRQIAKFYIDRYKMPKEVKSTNLGTALTDTVAKLNITELVTYDGVKEELKVTKEVLSLEKNISEKKDSIISNVETQNANLESAVKEYEKATNSQNKIIENTEKMFKKERNKKNAWKVISGVLIGVSGYLLLK